MLKIISHSVPTNIITGFLGTGKTTVLLNLLKAKPRHERWAILINEFGKIGVDSSFFNTKYQEEHGVFIREVPGGCMCCSSGLPMQIALNQLLAKAKPDRLLIEPTGLGHPIEVLTLLSSEHYQNILSIKKVITLVDARCLKDERYTRHKTFNQQIQTADLIIGNKHDLYSEKDKELLISYSSQVASPHIPVIFTENGQLDISILEGHSQAVTNLNNQSKRHDNKIQHTKISSEQAIPSAGYLKAENNGEGFQSIGWRFSPEKTFNKKKLEALFSSILVERLKAVMITTDGIFAYNQSQQELTLHPLDECFESKIEIITSEVSADWHDQLMSCEVN